MVDLWTLAAFVPAALIMNMTPGADMLFCMGQGLRSGPKAAVMASAGIAAGGMVQVTLAGLGLGALVAAHPWAFDVIRWIGVGYLIYLAWQVLRQRDNSHTQAKGLGIWRAFGTGFIVNLTNPKIILFVLAFIPQFVVPDAGSVLGQFLVFGAVLGLGGFVINGVMGIFAARISNRTGRYSRPFAWVSAGIFAGLAARLAILERT
ncbi:LysE family protein [Sulfitobacter noctilucicola]|uniref:Threonine/homoserine/homoserine lactone efflux protein n=1 Tax=Sulfitobacter noctilucicola TaxID=1342301 RepID=A0A7W6M6Q0_9RHOB|nr:LysE family translocator [Sulfitobacter noctilucicola]KIN62112.1 LysE family protein [Sulfitobacter noctilucicola]MBB4173369.1 threonine/homoserine/homoserine lactone efflux protein [Sulfitobacter noctilucicola]